MDRIKFQPTQQVVGLILKFILKVIFRMRIKDEQPFGIGRLRGGSGRSKDARQSGGKDVERQFIQTVDGDHGRAGILSIIALLLAAPAAPADILCFFLHFAGPPSTPLEFVFVAWNGDIVREAADAKWDGNGRWDITAYTGDVNDLNRAPVPEPCIMLLLGSGLVGVAAFGRKSGKA